MLFILEYFKSHLETTVKYAGAFAAGLGIASGIAHTCIKSYSV
jgi:hypothetical protein